jgi:crossover junction endodeoxyribonuclease RusA
MTTYPSETPAISFVVHGLPVAQGSKRTVPIGGGRYRAVEDNAARLRVWRAAVADVAGQAMAGRPLLAGPLCLVADFLYPRPRSHYGTGRNVGRLKPHAPTYKASAPDVDKTVRAICDALSGVVFRDDAQVAELRVRKLWAEQARCEIAVIVLA